MFSLLQSTPSFHAILTYCLLAPMLLMTNSCWFSTFTSYVNRLRGYHSQKDSLPGYDTGVIESYYYAMPERKMAMREFWPVKKAFHAREFPRSWMNIDMGVTVDSMNLSGFEREE